ncbi:MAG: restriction endonuclease subunit S [Tannerellaceae bacterium]|nr:restriction endonuclease subunit S [Tannerellaceae bacterium]
MSHYRNLPFEIPESWEWVRLGDIREITMGQSPSGISINNNYGCEFHQGKSYFGNYILNNSLIYTSKTTKIAPPNSLIMSVRAPVGDVNITDREICIGRGLSSLNPRGEISVNFMFYWISHFKKTFNKKATGTTFLAISGDIIRNQLIPFPPILEQARILSQIQLIYKLLDSIIDKL